MKRGNRVSNTLLLVRSSLSTDKTLVQHSRGTLCRLGILGTQANVLRISKQIGAPVVTVLGQHTRGYVPTLTVRIPNHEGQVMDRTRPLALTSSCSRRRKLLIHTAIAGHPDLSSGPRDTIAVHGGFLQRKIANLWPPAGVGPVYLKFHSIRCFRLIISRFQPNKLPRWYTI